MSTWKIAGVQMDCRFGDKAANLAIMRARLADAAGRGARLIIFPECALTGYCFDSLAEAARVLMLLGADLVLLPTNWPTGAVSTVCHLVQARALENHLYYAAVNRIGEERGFRFIGQSRIVAPNAELLAVGSEHADEIIV